MLQTLFYIPGELFGLPVFGFGLLLAVWAAAGAVVLAWLIRRQGLNADTRSYAQVLAVVGLAIAFLLPLLCEPRGLPIRGYGMMMLLAVLSGMGLAAYRARRVGVDPEMIFALAFWMIVPGIIGARAVYVAEYWSRDSGPNMPASGLPALLFAIFNVAGGGLVVYGSFFGGMLGLGLFWRRHRVPLLATADLVAPSLLLGLALGRVGCLLNGCCYGGPCDLPWKVTFPWNSPVSQHEAEQGVTDAFGLKFRDGPEHTVVIDNVAADSAAARAGLAAGMEIGAINGEKVLGSQQAAQQVLAIDKLDLVLGVGDNGEVFHWHVDDPPQWQTGGSGPLKIYGLEIAERPRVAAPDQPCPLAIAGIRGGHSPRRAGGKRLRPRGGGDRPTSTPPRRASPPALAPYPTARPAPIELALARPLPRSEAVHPTQIYSTIDALILCCLLLVYDRFRRRDGALTALMLTIYPVTRFLVERIRTDEAAIWNTGLHISQNISLALLAVAVCLWVYILRRPARLEFAA